MSEITLAEAQALVRCYRLHDSGVFEELDNLDFQIQGAAFVDKYGVSYIVFMELNDAPALVLLNAEHVRLSQNTKFRL